MVSAIFNLRSVSIFQVRGFLGFPVSRAITNQRGRKHPRRAPSRIRLPFSRWKELISSASVFNSAGASSRTDISPKAVCRIAISSAFPAARAFVFPFGKAAHSSPITSTVSALRHSKNFVTTDRIPEFCFSTSAIRT